MGQKTRVETSFLPSPLFWELKRFWKHSQTQGVEEEQGRSCLSEHQQPLSLPVPAYSLPKIHLLMGFISVEAAQRGTAPPD